MRPLAIDLFTGIHGWSEGLIAAGWRVIGYDLYDMSAMCGLELPPEHFELVLQDVLTLHGSQFKDAELIVGSSPCQEFSYRAMPWKRAKALGPPELGLALFHAQFRIQREASEAAGRYIPMVVENVRGANPWVGRAKYHYGSYYLWGDVPALMPAPMARVTKTVGHINQCDGHGHTRHLTNQHESTKVPGFRFDGSGRSFQTASVEGVKNIGGGFKRDGGGRRVQDVVSNTHGQARRIASAKIAKIPFTLAEWIGRTFLPAKPLCLAGVSPPPVNPLPGRASGLSPALFTGE